MVEPTRTEIKEFWEQCGWKLLSAVTGVAPDGNEVGVLPPIDLNSLFKYAVPRLVEEGYRISIEIVLADEPWYWWTIEKDGELWKADRSDPALALFWAIKAVFDEK